MTTKRKPTKRLTKASVLRALVRTDAPTFRCYHTWLSADGPAWHVHACAGLPSRHATPCRCACGELDYCTQWPATMPPSHTTARPPTEEALNADE